MMTDISEKLEKLAVWEELAIECEHEEVMVMRGMARNVKIGDTVHVYKTPEGYLEILKHVPRTLH